MPPETPDHHPIASQSAALRPHPLGHPCRVNSAPMRTLPLLLLLGACAGRDWRAARRADTSAAYASFVAANPTSGKVGAAMRRAEGLDWEEARTTDTSAAYTSYLGAHPSGPHADEARSRAEALAWDEAVAAGTPEALQAYVARHPGTPHADEATALIEEAWYRQARAGATEDSWGRYIIRYPEGRFISEARAERRRLAWEAAVAGDSRASYGRYVERFPDGEHRAEADAWLASSRVLVLEPVLVLRGTWQAASARAGLLSKVRWELDNGLLRDLKREFAVLALQVEDPNGADLGHPQDVWGVEEDMGLLVIEYSEAKGRAYEPSGHATDITATLSLYTPPTREPVWTHTLQASTPEKTWGETVDALHGGAVREWSGLVRSLTPEIESNRRKTP